ncbi:hypothetical protein RBH26_16375 [Natronolimnohabitans sp. A-GB9]|uniref:hypothetical protein n=1 Tax=Natronolimnohabitans sp. A-GB9 TaxID=3069757 RepID=UPI0027AF6F5A|nr:hypothetical protein [Natronolimnohabitans sp. A-GB9]MDQ2052054.1 hypothetical protein [Natronolimnohabitans sp. A-GB9]
MSDEPAADGAALEAELVRQYVQQLEAVDDDAERLLESLGTADVIDEPTRTRVRRHLREVRAQIHALVLWLRDRYLTDDPRAST